SRSPPRGVRASRSCSRSEPCVRALANHREKGERREDKEREPPTFDAVLQSNDQERAERDANQHTAEQMPARADDAAKGERNGDSCRERRKAADLLRSMPKNWIPKCRCDAQTVLPSGAKAPDAQREMTDVVREKKHPDHDKRASAEAEHGER